ncbi:hypothetical protein EBU95_12625 [bacterium]|nr:hypothetical protein [bacterium]
MVGGYSPHHLLCFLKKRNLYKLIPKKVEDTIKKVSGSYSKEELRVLKDFTLSDKDVAEKLNRTENAIYCKRWAITKGKYRKNGIPTPPRKRSSKISKIERPVSITEINSIKVNKIIFGNVIIDVINKTLIVGE